MSMLAERKTKQKWSLNPRGTLWSSDSNKFGQKMLEKMGWSHGKGLGANENGIKENIKISYKNDSKGMGFKENNEMWTEHSHNFNTLLKSLSIEEQSSDVKIKSSLEEKSQSSRVRVHYKKFTRGKDLSKRSEKELANIFGKKTLSALDPIQEVKHQSEIKPTDFTVNGGSIVDYFKKKMSNLGKSSENGNDTDSPGVSNQSFDPLNSNLHAPKHQLSVIEEESCTEFVENQIQYCVGTDIQAIKRSRSMKKQKYPDNSNSINGHSSDDGDERPSFKLHSSAEIEENTTPDNSDSKLSKKKKKKQNDSNLGIVNLSLDLSLENGNLDQGSETTNKGKKKRKNCLSDIIEESSDDKREKKNKKKSKNRSSGEVNPGFNLLLSSPEIVVERHQLSVIQEEPLREEPHEEDIDMENVEMEVKSLSTEYETPTRIKKKRSSLPEEGVTSVTKKRKKEKGFEDSTSTSPSTSTVNEMIKNKKKKKQRGIENPNFEDSLLETSAEASTVESSGKKKKKKDRLALENPSFIDSEDVSSSLVNGLDYEVKRKKKKKDQLAMDNPTFEDYAPESLMPEASGDLNVDLVLNVSSTPTILKTPNAPKLARRKSVRFNAVTQERIIPNKEDERGDFSDLLDINDSVIERSNESEQESGDVSISRKFDELQAQVENDMNESKATKSKGKGRHKSHRKSLMNGESYAEKVNDGTLLKFKHVKFGRTPHYFMKNNTSKAKASYKHLIKDDVLVCFKNANLHQVKGYGIK